MNTSTTLQVYPVTTLYGYRWEEKMEIKNPPKSAGIQFMIINSPLTSQSESTQKPSGCPDDR